MHPSLADIDGLIVSGRGELARQALRRLARRKLPREQLTLAAALYWRAGLPEWGLRLLAPWVRPDPRHPRVATADEKAEYAQCLVKCGALEEAGLLLTEIAKERSPAALLARASWHVAQWDYAASIAPLADLAGRRGFSPYGRLVAKVNLAAALVYERRATQATPLLRELLHDSHLRGYRLMHGRVLELTAESFIDAREWARAASFLEESRSRLAESAGLDELFARKLVAVTQLAQRPASRSALGALRKIRDEAVARGHWETVRDCDRREAVIRRDDRVLARLFFGTPFPHYRRRLLDDYGSRAPPPAFVLNPAAPRRLDLVTGEIDGKSGLVPGSVLHRLVVALTGEQYRPIRLVSLFSALHPDDHFHPESSPSLVHNTITRFRAWCAARRVDLAIESSGGAYRLVADGAIGIAVRATEALGRRHSPEIDRLRALWPREEFTAGAVLDALPLSRRTVTRLLNDACADGLLSRVGERRGTRYRFK